MSQLFSTKAGTLYSLRKVIKNAKIPEFVFFSVSEWREDQEKCVTEILEDIKSDKRTLRLLHGDVGSGKTIVAMIVAYYVIKSGYQVALLTPTELLATQHYLDFSWPKWDQFRNLN